jgi:hypothetical protein
MNFLTGKIIPNSNSHLKTKLKTNLFSTLLTAALLTVSSALAGTQPVTVTVTDDGKGAELAPRFMGLSYEMSKLLPTDGRYYFDKNDQALLNTFKTLGVKSLRVGANAVDNPTIAIPQEQDIDVFFSFARAAGVKVIYSFRLKDGNPADSARIASYIAARYADLLECFSIGNEPDFYIKTYAEYMAQWKPHYEAILKAVPGAKFIGPSTTLGHYELEFAKEMFSTSNLLMLGNHHYFLGSGRAGETNPPATRARFLSNKRLEEYEKKYNRVAGPLAEMGVPFRMDELNSCYNGGAKDSSDTYASTLWVLDFTHWWAARHIVGMNFHTGESVGRDGKFGAPNYASFLRQADGKGFNMRPLAYGLLAFKQGAQGRPIGIKIEAAPKFDFNAHAYRDRAGVVYLTLINKSYADRAQAAVATLKLPMNMGAVNCQRMELSQKNQDVAAKTDVMLGGVAVDPQGNWSGKWQDIKAASDQTMTIQVSPASATLLRFSPTGLAQPKQSVDAATPRPSLNL